MTVIDLIAALKGLNERLNVLNDLKVLVLQTGLFLEFTDGPSEIGFVGIPTTLGKSPFRFGPCRWMGRQESRQIPELLVFPMAVLKVRFVGVGGGTPDAGPELFKGQRP